jgi:hypothetical protein
MPILPKALARSAAALAAAAFLWPAQGYASDFS